MDNIQKLSASNIRFLLVMKYLIDCGEIPSCVRLTKALNCTKPSVHKMMKVLDEKGLISYKKRNVPTFTFNGLRVASQYAVYHQKMCELLAMETSDNDVVCMAVCAFLAELPEWKLDSLLK